MSLRTGPLDAVHRASGARMAEFGGWDMPLQYVGVLEEHRACREHAAVFDVSHLGSVRVRGPRAVDVLQWAFTNDLDRIAPGRAQYTHLLDPDDAHVVDDLIVWWVEPSELWVMPNASNAAPLIDALDEARVHVGAPVGECAAEDVTETRAVLAVQGPDARAVVEAVSADAAAIARFHVAHADVLGRACVIAGTGYTGEDGVEIHVEAGASAEVWEALVAAGAVPAGLGARDTLRLEAGLPLHGHELGPGITPLQAGLGWVVRFDKGPFRGSDALAAEAETGPARRLRGLTLVGRRPPRAGCPVSVAGEVVGEVTSGNFSPVLGHGIALAFLPTDTPDDQVVSVDVRGRSVEGRVVPTPFVHHRPG